MKITFIQCLQQAKQISTNTSTLAVLQASYIEQAHKASTQSLPAQSPALPDAYRS